MRRLASVIACAILFFSVPALAFEAPDIEARSAKYLVTVMEKAPLGPDRGKARIALADARSKARGGSSGRSRAIDSYQRAIAFGEDAPEVWAEFTSVLMQGNYRQKRNAVSAAWQAYKRSNFNSKSAKALALLGASLERARNYRMAIKAYRESLNLGSVRGVRNRLAKLKRTHGFRYRSQEVKTTDETPRACLRFNYELTRGRKVDYTDYLSISPGAKVGVSVAGKKLCLNGLSYGKTYRVTIRPGLPAADGERTEKSHQVTLNLGSRSEKLEFRGRAYILPKAGSHGIPLYSVNIDKVKLKVLRINDRSLIHQIVTRNLRKSLDGNDTRKIETQSGELVWQGEMDIDPEREKNQEVATAFPIDKALKKAAPGIYIVTAKPAGKKIGGYQDLATQWVVVSDLGLASIRGEDGLTLFLRSLDTAKPASGVTLKLYARNNEELGTARTDASGRATFSPGLLRGRGGNSPAAVLAYGPGSDFNFLNLTAPAFDLSDRGVAGRAAPGALDAFLYLDRGIYRPGGTAHVVALLRDAKANAVAGVPLTFRIVRPDGTEFRKQVVKPKPLGGYSLTLALPPTARTGRWAVRVQADPKGAVVGQTAFQVEDFVPERLAVTVETAAKSLKPGQDAEVSITGRWLYGAPASGLQNKGELVITADNDPHPAHKGYRFGLVNEKWSAVRKPLSLPDTDAKGRAKFTIALPTLPESSQPLKATARVSMLESGGRAVTRAVTMKVRRLPFEIGIKPRFKGEAIGRNEEAAFDVIAIGPDGKLRDAGNLRWEIVRERHRYRWYQTDDNWRYRVEIQDERFAKGVVGAMQGGRAKLARSMDWGRYRIEVYDPESGAATSVRFRAGWFVSADAADSPDKVELSLDKPKYRSGEKARVHIRAPYAGEALVTVATDRIKLTRNVAIPADGATVEIPVSGDWGGGAYVTATVLRPGAGAAKRGPGRAIGVKWLTVDTSSRHLTVSIGTPKETPSNRRIEVPVSVEGLPKGVEAYVTLAAVDEGILSLTGFKSPAPRGHYFGKRALGVQLRDAYGRLIDGRAGRSGAVRSGGGEADKKHNQSLAVRSTKAVALFSGIVRVDANGRAVVPLDIPSFAGKLRLMAVAYGKTRIGSGQKALLIRDPVVAQISLPRFLAPGDAARITLSLRNLSAPAGKYSIALAASGAVELRGKTKMERDLPAEASTSIKVTLRGRDPGVGDIGLRLKGPGGFALQRKWRIAVRPAQAVVTRHVIGALEPGRKITIDGELASEFFPGTTKVTASFSSGPNFDVPGLLASLDRYPYGCLEQTVSRALPLLYLSSVAKSAGVGQKGSEESQVRARVQDAIYRVLEMQRGDGSFALWSWSGSRERWLSAYAMDFLRRARKLGYDVPDDDYKEGLTWLTSSVASGEFGGRGASERTYALYVLSKAGAGNIGMTRQYFDTWSSRLDKMGLASAQLAAAFSTYGDAQRTQKALAKAIATDFNRGGASLWRHYGSPLRDGAAAMAMLAESGADNDTLFRLADWVEGAVKGRRYTSTQEKAWLLLAAHALFERQQEASIEIDGTAKPKSRKPIVLRPELAALGRGVEVRNTGASALRQVVTAWGVPRDPQPASANGFKITRKYHALDGKEVGPNTMKQGDLYIVVLSGSAGTKLDHKALVVDLLPAGLEIENTRLKHARTMDNYSWLPKMTKTRHMEFRDDRFVAAIDLTRGKPKFTVAYIVRAVTPGSYAGPAPYVEDMYKPQYQARGGMGKVEVSAR